MQAGTIRLTILALVFAGVVFLTGTSQSVECPGINTPVSPIANSYQQITVSTTAVGLTVPLSAKIAVISVEDESIRYRDDLVDPTASVGVLVGSGGSLIICGGTMERFKAIRANAADALLNVSYYAN